MDWLTILLHDLPRFDFQFVRIDPVSVLAPNWQKYVETLLWWSAVVGCVGLALFLVVLFIWLLACCRTRKPPVDRVARVRKLSAALFVLSVLCFVSLGICFFGNEQVNRGVTETSQGLRDVVNGMRNVQLQMTKFDKSTIVNSSIVLEKIQIEVAKAEKSVNASADIDKLKDLIANLSSTSKEMQQHLVLVNSTVDEMQNLSLIYTVMKRVEFERWISFSALFSIMVIVIFGAVVGFCRHSKKAAVIFSGVGVLIYWLGFALLACITGFSLATADVCTSVRPVIDARISTNDGRSLAMFYFNCTDAEPIPPSLHPELDHLEENAERMQSMHTQAVKLAEMVFENVTELTTLMTLETSILFNTVRQLGSVDTTLTCATFKEEYENINNGMCQTVMGGLGLQLLGLMLFNVLMFILLALMVKAWFLYSRKPLDYVEVDEDDPFLPPRNGGGGGVNATAAVNNTTNTNLDVYGSNLYNPRTRFASTDSDGNDMASSVPLWSRGAPPPNVRATETVYEHYS